MKDDTAAAALRQHAPILGRVSMALLGDAEAVTSALEAVARRAGHEPCPAGIDALAWLLRLTRTECSVLASQRPGRTRAPADLEADGPGRARRRLAELRPTEREALVLHLVGGLDSDAVAYACGIDRVAAEERLARGLSQIQQNGERR